jgi:hypothetical protein
MNHRTDEFWVPDGLLPDFLWEKFLLIEGAPGNNFNPSNRPLEPMSGPASGTEGSARSGGKSSDSHKKEENKWPE